MTDIVRRLRASSKLELAISGQPWTLGNDAADEITRLRAEVESWAQQADDRAKDAVRFAQERDEANADNDRLREALARILRLSLVDPSSMQRIENIAYAALTAKEGER